MRKLIGSLFVISTVLIATPASASPRTEPTPTASTGPYCSTSLSTGRSACFESEAALKQHVSASAELDLVYLYNWYNFQTGGGYKILTGSHACSADTNTVEYYDGNLGDNAWYPNGLNMNDTITSVKTASRCDIKFFEGTNFTGASTTYINQCSFLGGGGTGDCPAGNWNDRASSYTIS
ncbi:hypothetical protein ACWDZ4_05710 [Streptomyces sp. NPDC003016]